jgi:16S rRNA (cytidine1402-2'-O)-methyltransferase
MESTPEISGRVVLVPTPIGNMSDITLRALEILRGADRIACEDTRHSGQLLAHHGISGKPLVSLHEHNEARRAPDLIAAARAGETIAVISDAGMPGISDPATGSSRPASNPARRLKSCPVRRRSSPR